MDVLNFIEQYEGDQKEILLYFHNVFLSFPEIEDKIRYRVPFYYRKSWICYLNPTKKGGIDLAFVRANELSNEQGLLDFKDRKQVATVEFFKVKEIPEDTVNAVFQEALLLDETVPYTVRKSQKK